MSSKIIIVQPEDVWSLFQREQWVLRTQLKKIAENPEFSVVVYLTVEQGMAQIVVYVDDNEFFSEMCVSESDCTRTVRKVYENYLTSRIMNELFGEEYEGEQNEEEYSRYKIETEIDDRENELNIAVSDFLSTVLDGISIEDITDEADLIYDDIKEHFLEYLARKWDLPIRRPMYLEDESGEEFFEEYPYECMEFDDEDNPVYK